MCEVNRVISGSTKNILIPIVKYQSYSVVRNIVNVPCIKGDGDKTISFIDDDIFFLKLYRFGGKVSQVVNEINHDFDPQSEKHLIVLDWVKEHGFPSRNSPYVDINEDNQDIMSSSLFFIHIYLFRLYIDKAYKLKNFDTDEYSKDRITRTFGIPYTEWGKNNIGNRIELLMTHSGGIYPNVEFDESINKYRLQFRALSHISAACAQIAMALVYDYSITRSCIECGALFIPDGKERICSDTCKIKRRNFQCLKVRQKPVELRAPNMRRVRKEKK